MDKNEIREYAQLMDELNITVLEVGVDNKKIRIEKSPSEMSKTVSRNAHSEPESNAAAKGMVSIKSPFVGVFYAGPAEDAAPYISVGDRVEKGQILCVIEAMKMMNEITAEEEIEIVDVCVKNGQIVEFGTELFYARRVRN